MQQLIIYNMIYIGHKFYILQHIYNINGTFIFYCMQTVNFHKLKIYIRSQIQNVHCQILPQNLPIVKLISRHVINKGKGNVKCSR